MYAGYGSGEEHIKDKEQGSLKANIPMITYSYDEMWIGKSAAEGIVKVGESTRSFLIKLMFIIVFLTVLRASYMMT